MMLSTCFKAARISCAVAVMFALMVVLLNALSFASLAYVANRKGYHAMAALAAAGAWLFGVTTPC